METKSASWLGSGVASPRRTGRQRWSLVLLAISVLGTVLTCVALFFDGWIDAIAVYLVFTLVLGLLMSWLAGQRKPPKVAHPIDGGMAGNGGCQPSLILTRSAAVWSAAESAAMPRTVRDMTPLD